MASWADGLHQSPIVDLFSGISRFHSLLEKHLYNPPIVGPISCSQCPVNGYKPREVAGELAVRQLVVEAVELHDGVLLLDRVPALPLVLLCRILAALQRCAP
jgi:hypothetical protein